MCIFVNMLKKVHKRVNIIGIRLVYQDLKTAKNDPLQPFYNISLPESSERAYTTLGGVSFSEVGSMGSAGMIYIKTARIQFPNNDVNRAARIEKYITCKAVLLDLCDGSVLELGKNDYFQNSAVKAKVENTHNGTTITYTTQSINPSGYTTIFGLPEEIPVDL